MKPENSVNHYTLLVFTGSIHLLKLLLQPSSVYTKTISILAVTICTRVDQ